jgi:uncharacterized membrane protein YecN with MAPEG domain
VIAGPVSFVYAGLLGLLLIALSAQVVLARRRFRVRLGSGTEDGMQQAIRVQANFVEYVPLAVLLLVLAEIAGLPGGAVHGAGILLRPLLRHGRHLAGDRRPVALASLGDYSSFSISGTRVNRSPTRP